MHFWRQREITDRLLAERAARRQRLAECEDVQSMTAMLFDGHLPFRYDAEMITQTPLCEWEEF